MRYIGNILTKENFKAEEYLNVVSQKDDIIEGIPTLVIGWDLVKSLNIGANILNWEINEMWYWTFNRKVRRNRYEKDIIKFKELIFNNVIKDVNYKFVDILTLDNNEKHDFFNLLKDTVYKPSIIINNMLFISYNKTVYGISLNDIEYIGKNRYDFIKKITNTTNISLKKDIKIPWELKSQLINEEYILPYIYN